MLTQSARTIGKGLIETGLAAEYLAKRTAPSPLLPKSEYRLFSTAFHYGVAGNVNFDLDWRGALVAYLEDGTRDTDWGDLFVSTKLMLLSETSSQPAIGIRSIVKLPNTSSVPYRLGSNQMDFSINALLSRDFGLVDFWLNIGFNIIGDPLTNNNQNDTYSGSTVAIIQAAPNLNFFLEVYGVTGYHDDDDKLLIRGGAVTNLIGLTWNVFGSVRPLGSNRDFGASFEASQDWSLGVAVFKEIRIHD